MTPPWLNSLYNVKDKISGVPRQGRMPLLVLAGLVVALILLYQGTRPPALWAVKVDGQAVGWVEERQELEEALARLEEEARSALGGEVELASSLEFEQVQGGNFRPQEPTYLARRVVELLSYTVPAAAIAVDGEPVVALAREEDAQRVLEEVKDRFRPADEDTTLESLEIRERVEIVTQRMEAEEIKGWEEALWILLRGTDEVITHQVGQGESLWTIARKYDLAVEELRHANPQLQSDTLQVGQELDLVVPKPYLTVATKEIVTEVQSIPYETRTLEDGNLYVWERQVREQGMTGRKEVTWEITRENGEEVRRDLLHEEQLDDPVTQVVAVGTKMPVAQGTGSLAWPMDRGSITSRYGSRGGRLHSGVDIAAPTGSPIYAADSGVVTLAGWYGAYGQTVIIDHGGGRTTLYGHCSQILVRVGSKVNKGDLIARVGSTGRSSGAHLHFEVRENGRALDPMRFYQ